jgi:tetratricopeptide (TPR) repeat protein
MCFELPACERRALLDEADRIAAGSSTPLTLIELSMCRASLRDPTRLDETRDAIDKCRELVRRHGHELAAPERLLGAFALELGEYLRALTACDLVTADAAIERCRRVAEESQVMAVLQGLELMQAGRALGDGRLSDLANILERMRQADSLAGGFENVWTSYAVRLIEAQGGIASLAGFDAALPSFDELRPSQRVDAAVWIARLNAKIGTAATHERARRVLAAIPSEQLACMPARYGDLGTLCFLAEVYEELHDEAGAAALYPQLLPYAELNAVLPTFDYLGAVAHYLGGLARLLGQSDQASRHFEQAEAINRRLRLTRSSPRPSPLHSADEAR